MSNDIKFEDPYLYQILLEKYLIFDLLKVVLRYTNIILSININTFVKQLNKNNIQKSNIIFNLHKNFDISKYRIILNFENKINLLNLRLSDNLINNVKCIYFYKFYKKNNIINELFLVGRYIQDKTFLFFILKKDLILDNNNNFLFITDSLTCTIDELKLRDKFMSFVKIQKALFLLNCNFSKKNIKYII